MIRVRYTDIIRTFAQTLRGEFGLNVYDVVEDYPRACFMTNLEVTESERFMTKHIDDHMTMTIYYFPEDPDDNTAELAIMQEDLRDLFLIDLDSLISIKDKISLEILELRSAVVDDVLQVKMDMTMSHKFHKYIDYKVMNDLEVDVKNTDRGDEGTHG